MNKFYVIFSVLGLVLSVVSTTTEGCMGCINLDEYNFDKVVPKFEAVLVKFDVAYPYGDKHEIFNSLASEIVGIPDFVLGQVGIKDYGQHENENFGKQFGILSKEDLPALRLFVQGEDEPFAFEKKMPWNNENLKKFVRDHTNIYLGLPGCIEKFDKLAHKFIAEGAKEDVLEETQNEANKLTLEKEKEIADSYIKVMKKVIDNGYSFILQEDSRLEKILEGKVNEKKKRELSNRRNILKAFTVEPQKSEL
ncbi:unnamed protein product [Psylliodes chrysocephalus]|uniref:Protein windbeutel n=1 Tax=Psylliodes chrysocephalus TaxID=3402493 RepID=A0A9P0D4E4_9CUCU|nr:unnamed protein product [Psylliodes chrysocephala]